MAIGFSDGSVTTTSSEATVTDTIADAVFSMYLFLHNMTATETFRIKVYVRDENAGTLRLYNNIDYTGVQSNPAIFIPPLPTKEFKVSIQRTAGTDKAVTWQLVQFTTS